MPTEAEFEQTPDALSGRAMLDATLSRISPADRDAFWEAVRRCYASAAEDEEDREAS